MDCASSCASGVCSACELSTIPVDPTAVRPATTIAFWGTRLVWQWNSNRLSYRELCGGSTTEISPTDGALFGAITADGLLYQESGWRLREPTGGDREVPIATLGDDIEVDADRHVYAVEGWLDEVSMPHRAGWLLRRDGRDLSGDTLPEILLDGGAVYFVDGKLLQRRSAGGKVETVLATTDAHAPAPIAAVGESVFAVTGWSRRVLHGPTEPFVLYEVRAGEKHVLYRGRNVSCLATNRHGVAVCVEDAMIFVPYSGAPSRRLFAIDPPNYLAMDQHSGVALRDDGTIAWSIRSDPRTIRILRPPCK